jgi:TolB-like protein
MSRLKRLIVEIHRRSLWQVLLIYCGAALVAYQAVQALTEGLGLPQWFPAFAIVLFIVGLPIVLATACVHEVMPRTVTPAEPTPLTEAEAARVEAEAAAVHLETRRRHRFLTWRNAAATFVLVLAAWGVVAAGWMLFSRGADESATADYRPSVAVLPLENRSGLEEDKYFTDGIHDEILTQLSKIGGLSVRGRTSVMEYRDTPKNLRQIGEELNARYLVEGGVQRAGETVRINVQLIDAEADEHVFADTYDRELSVENLLAVQREVALRIADALQATFTAEERERVEQTPTDNPEAYDYYLRGRYYFHQRTPDGLKRAIEAYEEAIQLDSAFAPAYAGLASVYAVSVLFDYRFVPDPHSAALRALSMADAALSLDPNLAEAYAARTYIKTFLWVPFQDVVRDARQAIRLEPSSADAHGWYAHLLVRERRIDEAIREDSLAIGLDPLAPGRRAGFAGNAAIGDRYELALREADRALALVPGLSSAKVEKALSLLMLGHLDLCVQLDLGPYEGLRAMCLYTQGEVVEASAIIDSLSTMVINGTFPDSIHGLANPAASIATYYAWIGDASASLAWFERSIALSPTTVLFLSLESSVFDNVRGDADFWIGIERLRHDLRTRVGERG